MKRFVPLVVPHFGIKEIAFCLRGYFQKNSTESLVQVLSQMYLGRRVMLLSSGSAAFFLILTALSQKSKQKEVVLPAYTAGNIITCLRQAGLVPVLCDISLEDFNLDFQSCLKAINKNTLAVIAVHMFGIGIAEIQDLAKKIPGGVYLIEDCAQAMGSRVDNLPCGTFGDLSFFSFNRGKNLPIFSGGFILAAEELLWQKLKDTCRQQRVKKEIAFSRMSLFAKTIGFASLNSQLVYKISQPILSLFKDNQPANSITVKEMPSFQVILGNLLLPKAQLWFSQRHHNGLRLYHLLKNFSGLRLPLLKPNVYPVFSRFPVLIEDQQRLSRIKLRLLQAGIECSSFYGQPLHHMFDLGYKKEDFSNACYLARHLLTLPVHPWVNEGDLERIQDIFYEELR